MQCGFEPMREIDKCFASCYTARILTTGAKRIINSMILTTVSVKMDGKKQAPGPA